MNVLLWNTSYLISRGGTESHVHLLLGEFARRGIRTGLIAGRPTPAHPPVVRPPLDPAVTIHADRFPYPFPARAAGWGSLAAPAVYLGSVRRLAGYLRRRAPSVINLHYVGFDAVPLALLRRRLGYRLVLTFTGGDVALAERNRRARARMALAARGSDALSAVSGELCGRLERLFGRPAHRLHNGVPLDPLPAAPPAPGPFVYCGRLVPVKRVDLLLRAYAGAVARGVRAPLEIVGDGPEGRALRDLAAGLGLGRRVVFAGGLPEAAVAARLAGARALVLNSASEGLPMVALEAMALGRPVLATRVGGLPEVIDDGVEGWLVPPDDPAALVDRLVALDADADAVERAGRLARRRVEAGFTAAHMADAYLALYRSVLDAPAGPRGAAGGQPPSGAPARRPLRR